MTNNEFKFNLFQVTRHDDRFTPYVFLKRLWKNSLFPWVADCAKKGSMLASTRSNGELWFFMRRDQQQAFRGDRAWSEVSVRDVPVDVLLTLLYRSIVIFPAGIYELAEATERYYSLTDGHGIYAAMYPSFTHWSETSSQQVVIDVHATAFYSVKQARDIGYKEHPLRIASPEGFLYRPSQDSQVAVGDLLRVRNSGSRFTIDWVWRKKLSTNPTVYALEPRSKRYFLEWLMMAFKVTELVTLEAATPSFETLSEIAGEKKDEVFRKKFLQRDTLVTALSQLPHTEIPCYDRRTAAYDAGPDAPDWDQIFQSLEAAAKAYPNITLINRGRSPYDHQSRTVLLCVDREEHFLKADTAELDTKPAALKEFAGAATQSFTLDVIHQKRKQAEAEDNSDEVSASETVMFSCVKELLLKEEIRRGEIILPRPWLRSQSWATIPQCLFYARSKDRKTNEIRYQALHIDTEQRLHFLPVTNSPKALVDAAQHYEETLGITLTPITVCDDAETEETFKLFPLWFKQRSIVIRATELSALPTVSRIGLSEHYSGVHVNWALGLYYAGSTYAPPEYHVDKALTVRKVQFSAGQEPFLHAIVTLLFDPTVRLSSATVIPMPFKWLQEKDEVDQRVVPKSRKKGKESPQPPLEKQSDCRSMRPAKPRQTEIVQLELPF